jgi:addiction module HigA family antidote
MPPGETLREYFLGPLNLSVPQLAENLRVPATRIRNIVHGRRSISADTALRLARYFGTTPEFWTNLQARYDLVVTEDAIGAEIKSQVKPRRAA